jgi:hypothetical protein
VSNVTRTSPLKTPHSNAFANPSGIGSNAIVAAVAGARIRVLSVVMVSTIANSVKFLSAAADISATFPLAANGGLVLPFNEHGWFETNVGEALNLNMTAASATGTQVHYIVLLA